MAKTIDVALSEEQLIKSVRLLESEIAAHHNWIATAIEDPSGFGASHTAQQLVVDLRFYQQLACKFRGALRTFRGE